MRLQFFDHSSFRASTSARDPYTSRRRKSKLLTRVGKGDRLVVETAGGGGYGPPTERDRGALEEDVRNGKVSADAAREIYRTE